jgi:hypothetical protein
MTDLTARQLVRQIRTQTLRTRTGVLLLDATHFGKEPDLATQLDIEPFDYARRIREELPAGATHVSLDATTEEERLDAIAVSVTGYDCVLIYNFDLALARLESNERTQLWNNLWASFSKKPRALLLAVPCEAAHLLPAGEDRERWIEGRRMALASEL